VAELRAQRAERFAAVDLYPVTCQKLSAGRSDPQVLDGIIAGGARIIQLREKEMPARELYELAEKFREVTSRAGVLLIINDRVDLALAVDADGVHLGQGDLPIPAARRIAPDLILGASTHSLEQALEAEKLGADYINIGPIFPTETKGSLTTFLGPDAISEIGPQVNIPFTVMGGINSDNLDEVLAAGATRIAMVTAVTMAEDIARTTKEIRKRILLHGSEE
jgi:thiamine-phosphate pyrophosphorylase